MALLEQEAIRFVESLDDYEHVAVTDISGWGPLGYRVTVRDQRFDIEYEIASHCDYWDFVAALVDYKQSSAEWSRGRWRDAASALRRDDHNLRQRS